MTYQTLENIVSALTEVLTIENGLLKEFKAQEALIYLEQKNQLMDALQHQTENLKKDAQMLYQKTGAEKDHLRDQVKTIYTLAQENDSLIDRICQINQRIMNRIMTKVRKITSPVDFYTAQGQKNQLSQYHRYATAPMAFSNQI
ncbi:MAG: hypothetical protein ACRYGR_06645 [Janthinobacterium lividum]